MARMAALGHEQGFLACQFSSHVMALALQGVHHSWRGVQAPWEVGLEPRAGVLGRFLRPWPAARVPPSHVLEAQLRSMPLRTEDLESGELLPSRA